MLQTEYLRLAAARGRQQDFSMFHQAVGALDGLQACTVKRALLHVHA